MKTTKKVVGDGQRRLLSAEEYRMLDVRKNEIVRRIEEGTLHYTHVMAAFQAIIEAQSIVKVFINKGNDLEAWDNFYGKYFKIPFSFTGLMIPPKPTEGNWRLLVILKGLTNNQVYDDCKKQFACYKYADDLDTAVPTNERDPRNCSYAIWVRDTVEADDVHKDKSANMVAKEELATETLLERMIHELVYFSETGKHLDVKNVTLCSGSRNSDSNVPSADWYDGKFRVHGRSTDDRVESLRVREVVAVETSRKMVWRA